MSESKYMVAKEAAAYTRMTLRALHEHTSKRRCPARKLSGSRKLLFVREELDAWLDGAPLEQVELPGGGWRVKPVEAVTA